MNRPSRLIQQKHINLSELQKEAWQLMQAGELQKAFELYQKITRSGTNKQPGVADAWHMLGVIEHRRGNNSLAVNHIRKAIQLNPEVPDFYNNLAVVYQRLGMAEEAKKLLKTCGHKERLAKQQYYNDYESKITQLRNSPYMEYPCHVHMETLALCNASCKFCPYSNLERRGSKMPDELVAKIIDDLTAIPSNIPFQFSPFKINEPLLDKRLCKIMSQINEKLPHAELSLTTNASLITDRLLARFSGIRKMNYLWISINEHRKESYEQIMKLCYDQTVRNLNLIHAWKANGRLGFQVVLSRVGDNSEIDKAFCNWVRTKYPLFIHKILPRGGWLGQMELDQAPIPHVRCQRWFELSITATGKVAHCCMDGQCRYPIGDVTVQHALEVYNNPAYRLLRESTQTRLDSPICKNCSFI